MKIQEEKLRHVKEVADEKWHEDSPEHQMCSCGYSYLHGRCEVQNPSPTDLNELFRLAEKLVSLMYSFPEEGNQASYDINLELVIEEGIFCSFIIHYHEGFIFKGEGDTQAEAILNALFIATGDKE